VDVTVAISAERDQICLCRHPAGFASTCSGLETIGTAAVLAGTNFKSFPLEKTFDGSITIRPGLFVSLSLSSLAGRPDGGEWLASGAELHNVGLFLHGLRTRGRRQSLK